MFTTRGKKGKKGRRRSEVSLGQVAPWIQFPSMPDILNFEPEKTKRGYKRIAADEKIEQMLDTAEKWAAENGQEQVALFLKQSEPAVRFGWKAILVAVKLYTYLFRIVHYFYFWAPKQLLTLCFGVTLCFFGGSYVATLAAVEAWRKLGWQHAFAELKFLHGQFQKDDDEDLDGDGIADVDQVTSQELLQRKTIVAMKTIGDPARFSKAVGALYTAYLAVLATLQLQFAEVVALSLGMAEILEVQVGRHCLPFVSALLDTWGVQHWAKTTLEVSTNLVIIFFAWFLQSLIAAFYSGLRGGKMAGDAFVALWAEHAAERMPTWVPAILKAPAEGAKDSRLDEIFCYGLFALGFFFQLSHGFAVPFPLNVVLLPVSLLETFLRYQVTWH